MVHQPQCLATIITARFAEFGCEARSSTQQESYDFDDSFVSDETKVPDYGNYVRDEEEKWIQRTAGTPSTARRSGAANARRKTPRKRRFYSRC
jgi:hypothetical protein